MTTTEAPEWREVWNRGAVGLANLLALDVHYGWGLWDRAWVPWIGWSGFGISVLGVLTGLVLRLVVRG